MHHGFQAFRRLAMAVLLATALPGAVASAAEPLAFLLPDDDGYGIAECFAAGNACGQGVADGWCEAHGHLRAVAFGAGDVTGSIAGKRGPVAPGGIAIRCAD